MIFGGGGPRLLLAGSVNMDRARDLTVDSEALVKGQSQVLAAYGKPGIGQKWISSSQRPQPQPAPHHRDLLA